MKNTRGRSSSKFSSKDDKIPNLRKSNSGNNTNIFTRQTRHKVSPNPGVSGSNSTGNEGLLDVPQVREDGSLLWNAESEILLYKEIINHRLCG